MVCAVWCALCAVRHLNHRDGVERGPKRIEGSAVRLGSHAKELSWIHFPVGFIAERSELSRFAVADGLRRSAQ